MNDDLDPISDHAFEPGGFVDPSSCGHVEDNEVCGWPESDHLTSVRPEYQPDPAYLRMLRGEQS